MSLEAFNINGGLIADGNSGDVVDGVPAAADDVLIVLMYTSFSGDSTDGTDAGTGNIATTSYSSFHCKKNTKYEKEANYIELRV